MDLSRKYDIDNNYRWFGYVESFWRNNKDWQWWKCLQWNYPEKTHSLRDILEIPRTTSKKRVDLPMKLGRMLGNHGKETGWLDVFERKLKQQTRKKCNFSKNTKARETVPLETDIVEVSVSTVFSLSFQMNFKLSLWVVSVYLCVVVPILELSLWVFLFVEFVLWIFDALESFSVNAEFLLVKNW